jgi:LytS/YehU family sensor histidine kinase
MLLYYLVQKTSLKSYWTLKTDKTIVFFTVLASLVFGINMANKVDEEQASFWVSNGNIWLVDVFAVIILLLFLYVIFSWIFKQWKSIQKLKNEKAIAELALLKNQINPHFFFNTLNNLYSLIKNDPDTAQDYVLKLSDMMRFTIYKGQEEMVSLQEEVTYLSNFIELQTARYHKKIEIDFQQYIESNQTLIPPLLFIILLENAFKHGVESLVDNAFIHLELKENERSIVFSISNNYDSDEISKGDGIGLENLKERLHLLYPKAHNLTSRNDANTYSTTLELHKG